MADITLDQVVTFFQNLGPGQATKLFDDLITKSASFSTAFSQQMTNVTGGINNATTQMGKFGQQIQSTLQNLTSNNITDFLDNLRNLAQINPTLINQFKELSTQIGLMYFAVNRLPEPKGFSILGRMAEDSSSNVNETIATVNRLFNINPASGGLINRIVGSYEAMQKLAEPAKKAELGLLAMASASGEFGDLLKRVGPDMAGLSQETEKFSKMTYEAANATGRNGAQIAEYAKMLKSIPGAMDTIIKSTDGTNDNFSLLSAAIKVADGTGQHFSEVFRSMNTVYQEFGTTGQKALEYVSRLSEASRTLKTPLEIVKQYTENAARSFRFLGDNTQGAINIIGKLGPALQNSGLGPKAIADLVGNVTSSIAKMDVAQKAFLAGQTGRTGGLQGAFQIDLALKQGKVDEVYNKVEQSLRKQFGGRIVTLEEAAKSQAAAGQFQKQISLLTSGPTAIAGSNEEAQRILEAFSKGQTPKAAEIKTGPEALKSAIETGNKIEERQYDVMTKISNSAERASMIAAITAANQVQGNKLLEMMLGDKLGPKLKEFLSESREKSENLLADIVKGKTTGETDKDVINGWLEEGKNFVQSSTAAFERSAKEKGKPTSTPATTPLIGYGGQPINPNLERAIKAEPTIPTATTTRVAKTLNRPEREENPVFAAAGKPTNRIGTVQEKSAEITLKPLCAKCLQDMPDQQKILQLIDGKIEVLEGGRATAATTGIQKR